MSDLIKSEKLIQSVISSNLDQIILLTKDEIPILNEFPLCGKWRKNVTLLHISAAYGSLTCIQYFINKIDINSITNDISKKCFNGVFFFYIIFLIGLHFIVLQ